ncbi:MAG: alpha/beta fold hydrolase [Alphaproteobacteria bacterium]|nr:MAG: alpha/beta fold hydrolase [Alphaproteobacteria bacterium]
MIRNNFHSDFDQLEVSYVEWAPAEPARAVCVIAHGLGEHIARYDRFAREVVAKGIHVLGPDHRGHGQSMIAARGPGDFGEGGWNALCADLVAMIKMARARVPGVPLILFGHSLGSFASQQVVQDHSQEIDALILSGSCAYDLLAEALFAGLMEGKSAFEIFNAEFEPARTPADWLSRDEVEVDKYVADPLCGFDMVEASAMSAASESPRLADPAMIARIRSDLPVLFVAGDLDPLNDRLARLVELEKRWRSAGVRQIDTHYYPGARHELLNETNRDDVTRDILAWIQSQLPADG